MANPPQPGNVTVTYASGNDIECQYSYTPLPTNPTSFQFVWGTVNNPLDAGNKTVDGRTGPMMTAVQEFLVTPGVTVYIWGKISYTSGGSGQINYSPAPLVFTSDTTGLPGSPYVVGVTGNQITVNFEALPVPGNTSYAVLYNTVNDPNAPGGGSNTVFVVESPSIFGSGPFQVAQGVNVYVWSRTVTDGVTRTSAIPLVYNSGTPGTPPSGPTSTPALVQASNTQITVSFNATGVTGTAPFAVVCGASMSPTGPFDIATFVSGTFPNYRAVTIEELDFATTYYFQTIISNGILPNQTSAVSAGFATTDVERVANPVATYVTATQVTMRFTLSVTYFTATQNVAELRWGTQNVTSGLLPNSVAVTYIGLIRGDPVWEGTVYGLTPGRNYYFQGYYVPIGPTFASGTVSVTTYEGNTFDLGYMPPRGWAVPNPVIVAGVSQPWRQT
jgi:hypothetical protein